MAASNTRQRKQPLTRKQKAIIVGKYAGATALYAGVGYGYYRAFTTADQRSAFRSGMRSFAMNPRIAASRNLRIAKVHARGFAAKRGIDYTYWRKGANQRKFNRYYKRRTQKQMFGMRVTAARMRATNARNYKNYSRGRFGNMVNTTARGRSGRVRRDYKGRFAGWM